MIRAACLIAICLVMLGGVQDAQAALKMESLRELKPATNSELRLQIFGWAQFGFGRSYESKGWEHLPEFGNVEAESHIVQINASDIFGSIRLLYIDRSNFYFSETTVLNAMKDFNYWKDKDVFPRDNGNFIFKNMTLKWIVFSHTATNNAVHECFAYTTSGRGGRFMLRGEWCVANGKPMTEADVRNLVNAIGYKDILIPTPLPRPPGVDGDLSRFAPKPIQG